MAGAGYKLFNTGDVLTAAQVNTYLMEQSVMVFADAAARTTALSGVVAEGMLSYLKDTNAVEVYNGSAWVASDDPNAIQNTIVDAKGDLIAASANDTPARLAVGNNGETLVADSSATVGLRYSEPKTDNPFLNAAFQIWQRGTSIAGANTNTYTADRWCGFRTGSTYTRQVTNDTTNLPNIQYCARVQRDSGGSGTSAIYLTQALETINSIQFAGKIVTLSFYARKGADYSAASDALSVTLQTGTGTDQQPINNFTGSANPISTTATLTGTWQRFTFTSTTLSTSLTQIRVAFLNTPVGTAGAADYYEITGVQLDIGSVALPFRTYAGTIAGELAACQRYYYRTTVTATGQRLGWGHNNTTLISEMNVLFPVTMRTAPTALETTGTASDYSIRSTNNNFTCDAVPTFSNATTYIGCFNMTTASTMTAGNGSHARANASTTYLGWSAEL